MRKADKEHENNKVWNRLMTGAWLAGVLFLLIVLTSCSPKPYHFDEVCREVNREPTWKYRECTKKEWFGEVPQKKGGAV